MSEEKKPFHNPFAALGGLRDALPTGTPKVERKPQAPQRAVVRMERAGRRGKEVTVIEQLALAPAEREVWLKELKTSLGCGGTLEGDDLILQGDLRDRVKKWLESKGVKRIS